MPLYSIEQKPNDASGFRFVLFVGYEFHNGMRWTVICRTSNEAMMRRFCARNGIDYEDAVRRVA